MDEQPQRAATKRDAQKAQAREAVLTAAAKLFATSGYKGASIDDIAEASGVRKNTLLYHFGSKEALWRAVVDHVFAEVDAFFAAELPRAARDSREGFEAFARLYFRACLRHPAYVLIPMLEGVTAGWRCDYIADNHLRRHVHNFDAYVRRLVALKVLPDVDPLHLQNLLTGGAQLFLSLAPLWRTTLNRETDTEEFVEAYARSTLGLLRHAGGSADA
jgi:AcrR family transcriptional regulator